MRTSVIALASLTSATLACTDAAAPPPPPPVPPSPLARCADPAVAVTTRWRVDNVHAPITALAGAGASFVIASADGAVKPWHLSAAGATAVRPGYGEPLATSGVATAALTATADGTVAAIDVEGGASTWIVAAGALGPRQALLPAAGVAAALDDDGRWLAGATDSFAGDLTLVELATGARVGPLTTTLWHAAAARLAPGDRWLTVGEWYGCPAIERRDLADPTAAAVAWDTCNGAGGGLAQGWFRSLATDPSGASVVAAGDQLIARFDSDQLAAGPRALATTDVRIDRVLRLDGDGLAVTLAQRGDGAELTWWTLADLRPVRTEPIAAAVDIAIEPTTGVIVAASADGLVRGYACE
ncbi:MAG: hypothetical protein IPL61_26895 [Myxococcales bacterium]|nr:hypothetical protein [Myxococcales bacterium]